MPVQSWLLFVNLFHKEHMESPLIKHNRVFGFLQVPAQPRPGVVCQPVSRHTHGVTPSLGNEVWQSREGQLLSPTFVLLLKWLVFVLKKCFSLVDTFHLFHYWSQALQYLKQVAFSCLPQCKVVCWRDLCESAPVMQQKLAEGEVALRWSLNNTVLWRIGCWKIDPPLTGDLSLTEIKSGDLNSVLSMITK